MLGGVGKRNGVAFLPLPASYMVQTARWQRLAASSTISLVLVLTNISGQFWLETLIADFVVTQLSPPLNQN